MDFWESELSIKIGVFIILFFLFTLIANDFIDEAVPALYDNRGNIIAAIGMTKNQVILNMGRLGNEYEDELSDYSCLCYPVTFRNKIKTNWRWNNVGFNYVKIIFHTGRIEEIYFFGYTGQKGSPCTVFPPLAIRIKRDAYK